MIRPPTHLITQIYVMHRHADPCTAVVTRLMTYLQDECIYRLVRKWIVNILDHCSKYSLGGIIMTIKLKVHVTHARMHAHTHTHTHTHVLYNYINKDFLSLSLTVHLHIHFTCTCVPLLFINIYNLTSQLPTHLPVSLPLPLSSLTQSSVRMVSQIWSIVMDCPFWDHKSRSY